ncbi:hypothetical protein BDF19DRAFT_449640 [Syncephalis fuscata]|nr:hypothetical protein BDF19DRAFT_449640 [Syncephalis fuscata]
MCLTMLCSAVWPAILFLGKFWKLTAFFYFIECSICSTILIENCRRTRHILSEANHPKTERMLHISQIPLPIYETTNVAVANLPTTYAAL